MKELNYYNMFGEWTETDRQTDRQTATLNYGGTKPKTTSQSTSGLLIGPEQVTWHETLQATGR